MDEPLAPETIPDPELMRLEEALDAAQARSIQTTVALFAATLHAEPRALTHLALDWLNRWLLPRPNEDPRIWNFRMADLPNLLDRYGEAMQALADRLRQEEQLDKYRRQLRGRSMMPSGPTT